MYSRMRSPEPIQSAPLRATIGEPGRETGGPGRIIAPMESASGPLPSDIQPVANETRDRIITGLVTLVPFVAIVFAGWQVWGEALHWSDVFLFVGMYLLTGLGITVGFHRHLTHRSFKTHTWLHGLLG